MGFPGGEEVKWSEVAQSYLTLCDPVDCSPAGSQSMRFSRQEHWRGSPFPSPGDLPDPEIKPRSPTLQPDALTSEPPGKPVVVLSGKEPASQYRRQKRFRFDPGSGRSPGGGHGNQLYYSCLENPMDRGAWQSMVHRVSQSRIQLKQLSTAA